RYDRPVWLVKARFNYRTGGGWPTLSLISTPEGTPSLSRLLRQGGDFDFPNCRVPLDKREGSVKGVIVLCSAEAPVFLPERLRTKALEISRGIISRWKIVPPTIDSACTSTMILLCEHPAAGPVRKWKTVFCFPRRAFCAVFCTGPFRDARAPNQHNGLACADQGHPRAALDANDLWIRFLRA